jgi:hypothetical protein
MDEEPVRDGLSIRKSDGLLVVRAMIRLQSNGNGQILPKPAEKPNPDDLVMQSLP